MSFLEVQTKKTKQDFLSRTSKAEKPLKRTFLFLLSKTFIKGSATLEAVLIIPICFCFLLMLMWIFFIYYCHSQIGEYVYEEGYRLVTDSYANLRNEMVASEDCLKVKRNINKFISANRWSKYIEELNYEINENYSDNEIDISVVYKIHPFVNIPGVTGITLSNNYYSKAYVGRVYRANNSEKVYITKDSLVYHTDITCRVLKSNINRVTGDEIIKQRNKDGKKYYPCTRCFINGSRWVYFTSYGVKYHSDEKCRDLKTTIYSVWESDVIGRRKCSFCP